MDWARISRREMYFGISAENDMNEEDQCEFK